MESSCEQILKWTEKVIHPDGLESYSLKVD